MKLFHSLYVFSVLFVAVGLAIDVTVGPYLIAVGISFLLFARLFQLLVSLRNSLERTGPFDGDREE